LKVLSYKSTQTKITSGEEEICDNGTNYRKACGYSNTRHHKWDRIWYSKFQECLKLVCPIEAKKILLRRWYAFEPIDGRGDERKERYENYYQHSCFVVDANYLND